MYFTNDFPIGPVNGAHDALGVTAESDTWYFAEGSTLDGFQPYLTLQNARTTATNVTLTYATAKAILVDGDAAQAMNAFMSGKIRVDGDITKMIALQTAGQGAAGNPAAAEVVKKIQNITA